jgi:hypothetical protein
MVGALAISTQSYWIDEALSLIVAMAPNPTEAWKYAQAVSGSTLQMPLEEAFRRLRGRPGAVAALAGLVRDLLPPGLTA